MPSQPRERHVRLPRHEHHRFDAIRVNVGDLGPEDARAEQVTAVAELRYLTR